MMSAARACEWCPGCTPDRACSMLAGFLDARLRERLSYVARGVAHGCLDDRIVAMALVKKQQGGLRTDTLVRLLP